MTYRYLGLILAASLSLGAVSSSLAAEADCACRTALPAKGAVAGSLLSSKGQVLVSQSAGYAPAQNGSPLGVGSHIMVGPQSQASIAVGSCKLTLSAGTDTDIVRSGDALCIRTQDPVTTASTNPLLTYSGQSNLDPRTFNFPRLMGMFITTVGIGTVATRAFDEDDSVSRQ